MISIAIHNNAAIKIEKGNIKDPNQKKKKSWQCSLLLTLTLEEHKYLPQKAEQVSHEHAYITHFPAPLEYGSSPHYEYFKFNYFTFYIIFVVIR